MDVVGALRGGICVVMKQCEQNKRQHGRAIARAISRPFETRAGGKHSETASSAPARSRTTGRGRTGAGAGARARACEAESQNALNEGGAFSGRGWGLNQKMNGAKGVNIMFIYRKGNNALEHRSGYP